MKKYFAAQLDNLERLCQRPTQDYNSLFKVIKPVFQDIKTRGDQAVAEYTEKFDGKQIQDFRISSEQINAAEKRVPNDIKEALKVAAQNIEKFQGAQASQTKEVQTMPGVKCFSEPRPIQKVGLYIPGGSAPLPSTLLMLTIPAKLAGCQEIIICSPPNINDVILYAAKLAGVDKVFQIGGAQAIAAMTYGTTQIPQVSKICGPGNQFVTAAKMLAQQEGLAIDMPAGPSELLIIADQTARPDFLAADLLSQTEHGPDSQVVLVSPNESKIDQVLKELDSQLANLSRKEIAAQSLKNSFALIVEDLTQAINFSNQYAPEHLIINTANPRSLIQKIINAGSVFLGPYSSESAGDYASGPNHTLPTSGFAKSYSGVSIQTFQKQVTFQELSPEGIKSLGPTVEKLAECEGLDAHKNSMSIRINALTQKS